MRFPIPGLNDNEAIKRIMKEAIKRTGLSYELPEKPKMVTKKRRRRVDNFHVRVRESRRSLRQQGESYGEWEFNLDVRLQTKLEAAYFAHRTMKRMNRRKWLGSCYSALGLDRMRTLLDFGPDYPFFGLQVFNRENVQGPGVIVDSYLNLPNLEKELSRGPWFWRRPDRRIGEVDCVPKQMLIGWDPETGKPYVREWRSLLEFVAGGRVDYIEDPLTLDFRLAALQQNEVQEEEPELVIRLWDPPVSAPGEPVGPERREEPPERPERQERPSEEPERLPETPNPEAERRRNRIPLREKYRQQLEREREEE